MDSTNNYAMAKVQKEWQTWNGWFAHDQTAGKGQRGKHWESKAGQNIAMTVVVDATGFSCAEPFIVI